MSEWTNPTTRRRPATLAEAEAQRPMALTRAMKIHPVTTLFPLMSEHELAGLAADIQANGQIHPIVFDEHGILLDGRNRWAACQRAQVAPQLTTYTGSDPVGFILSVNARTRHMDESQRAMVAARDRFDVTTVLNLAKRAYAVLHDAVSVPG